MTRSSEFGSGLSPLYEEIRWSNLLPRPYPGYRPLLAGGLCFFLERLSVRRLSAIFAEQTALPALASAEERLVRLLRPRI